MISIITGFIELDWTILTCLFGESAEGFLDILDRVRIQTWSSTVLFNWIEWLWFCFFGNSLQKFLKFNLVRTKLSFTGLTGLVRTAVSSRMLRAWLLDLLLDFCRALTVLLDPLDFFRASGLLLSLCPFRAAELWLVLLLQWLSNNLTEH